MSCTCDNTVIEQVKVILPSGSLSAQNGLTLTNLVLELGGALLHNTDITGNYQLNLGTTGSRLSQVNLRSNNQLLFDFNNGSVNANLSISSSGIILTDALSTPKGLIGASDYSANYTANTYIQKTYADSRIASKTLSATLGNPGAGQNGYFISWDNAASKFTLTANALTAPGSDKQIIFNDGGNAGASNELTFNKTTGVLTSGYSLVLKDLFVAGSVNVSAISNSGSGNTDLFLNPFGDGNLYLSTHDVGIIYLGSNSNTATLKLQANGSPGTLDIAISPKGSTGKVTIGDLNSGGASRILAALGTATDINLVLLPKGVGNVDVSNRKVTNLLAGSAGSDAVRFDQLPVIPAPTYIVTIVNIGDWNMDINATTTVPHGLSDYKKYRGCHVVIRDDADSVYSDNELTDTTGVTNVGTNGIDGTIIGLVRRTGSTYDSANYDSVSYNRGYVMIFSIP